MKFIASCILGLCFVQLYACNSYSSNHQASHSAIVANTDTMKLKITVGDKDFTTILENNETVSAFKSKLPLTMNMKELNGNEKYGELPGKLPTNASNPGTIQAGDLMLYGSNTVVLFYKTFSTSYSYTRLGRIEDVSGLADALGSGDVTVKLE